MLPPSASPLMSNDQPSNPPSSSLTMDGLANTIEFGRQGKMLMPDDSGESLIPSGQRQIAERYDIIGMLGSGGMGNVYKVRDRTLEEVIALKTLHRRLADDELALTRFHREVKLARRVTHPNVARTFDIGTDGELTYLTMEFIDGVPLNIYLSHHKKISLASTIELVVQIARGLEAAHAAGVIHRDLKPANIMVSSTGRAVITDFGIARASQRDANLQTAANGLVGTPLYMAPEQVEGNQTIDHRADIYALGVILFEILEGTPPWKGETPVSVALARLLSPPPRISESRYPRALVNSVERAMARSPENRQHNAGQFASELEGMLGGMGSMTGNQVVVEGARSPGTDEFARTAFDAQQPFTSSNTNPSTQSLNHQIHRVAILPIINRGDPEDNYLSEALAEEMLGELSMSRALRIKPAAHMQGVMTEKPLTELGQELDVQLLINGSIRRMGDQIRVRLALISVDEGFQVWGEKFIGTTKEIFKIAEDASEAIAEALRTNVSPGRPEALSDPVAIDLYMRARHANLLGWYEGMEESIELYRRALQRSPQDPRILTGFATSLARETFFHPLAAPELLGEARKLATEAVALAPDWPDPHYALAIVAYNEGDMLAAETHSRDALKRHTDHPEALDLLGRVLAEMGPLDEAAKHLERALDINEQFWRARTDLQRVYALQGRWLAYEKLIKHAPPVPESFRASFQAVSLRFAIWRGDLSSVPMHEDPIEMTSSLEPLFRIAQRQSTLLRDGKLLSQEEVESLFQVGKAEPTGSQRQLLVLQLVVEFACSSHLTDMVFEALSYAIDMGLRDLMWVRHAPILNSYRLDERFEPLVERIELKYRLRRQYVTHP